MTSTANLDVRIALTTIGSEADAIALAKTLVDERLAACVNVLPAMISIYRLSTLEARLRQIHPYELPEFLVVDLAGGGAAYLAWVKESVTP